MGNILDCGTEALAPLPDAEDGSTPSAAESGVPAQPTPAARLTTLDGPTALHQSLVWQLQRSFYDVHSLKAWSNAVVPNFVTSNAFIGRAYASIVAGVLRDLFDAHGGNHAPSNVRGNPSQPVYIVEVGAGHGRLAFLIVSALMDMRDTLPPHELEWPFVYVMTDFSEKNVEGWESHPQLRAAFDAGVLDTAVFDAEATSELRLRRSGTVLSADTAGLPTANPLVVICNYVFDSLTNDAIQVVNGEVRRALVTVTTPRREDAADSQNPDIIQRMQCSFQYEPVAAADDLYGGGAADDIVRQYRKLFTNSATGASCLIPVGGLQMAEKLVQLSGGRVVMLVGDKGYTRHSDMLGLRDPHIARHGSFSCMVNFHALRMYFESIGGVCQSTKHQDGFKVALFATGGSREDFMHANWAFADFVQDFGPENFSTLQRCVKEEIRAPSMPVVLALLRLSRCDADVYYKFRQTLLDKVMYSSPSDNALSDLAQDISGVSASYYALSPRKDVCFELGRLLMSLKRHGEACQFFESSNAFCGEHHVTWHNLGICCFYVDNLPAALDCFSRSMELDPHYADARTWYRKVSTALVRASSAGQSGKPTRWQG